jgi:chromosome segregation ATPase
MTTKFALEALLVARRARRDGAFERVRACREEVRDAETARDAIAKKLQATLKMRADCVERLVALARDASGSVLDYERAEGHIAMLRSRADDIRADLARADHTVAMARTKLQDAIALFMRAQARLDAVLEQKAKWQRELERERQRREEILTDDLIVNRYAGRR